VASYEIQPRNIFPYNAIAMGVFCETPNGQKLRHPEPKESNE
jgi:hypothetical protein